jgi:hypothetical protein
MTWRDGSMRHQALCSSLPAPPACLDQLISTFCVSPARCLRHRAHPDLHLPRTLRHDNAAVQMVAWPDARTMQPDSTPVARQPSLYRD